MNRRWLLIGTLAYAFLCLVIFPMAFGVPSHLLFGSDDAQYSSAAVNLLRHGFYSLDGIRPYMDREPGQSVLLAFTYGIFGIENALGIYLVQSILVFISSLCLSSALTKITNERIGGMCFLLLLVSGSLLHGVFSAYREALAFSFLALTFSLLLSDRSFSPHRSIGIGLLLGCSVLTYYPLFLFPVALGCLWMWQQRRLCSILLVLLSCYAVVGLWSLRNQVQFGKFQVVDDRRTNVAWYVRGQQAENVRGLEPLRCLIAEYVTRDWSGRSPDCSFNAVMHERWPTFEGVTDTSEEGRLGRSLILEHPISYLWFSVFEVLELHAPYVGGGWPTAFNVYALLTQVLLFAGMLGSLPLLWDRRFHALVLLLLYVTAVFIITDATPRYLVPVLFGYAALSAFGYDRLLNRFKR